MAINNSASLDWWQNTMHLMEQFISIMLHSQGKFTATGRGRETGERKDIKGKFKDLSWGGNVVSTNKCSKHKSKQVKQTSPWGLNIRDKVMSHTPAFMGEMSPVEDSER